MSAVLEVESLQAGYGDVAVLHGVDLTAGGQRITAVVGSNGAGKTTLMRALAGLLPAAGGGIRFDGADITAQDAHERVAQGVVLVPEGRLVFPEMSVRENLFAGAINPRARGRRAEMLATVYELFPRLKERSRQAGGTLSGGEQQMLALGRGLMACPRLLLLDEPTLGLAPAIARQIFQVLPTFVELGLTVVIAEQDVTRTLKAADRAYVLENGQVKASGAGADLLDDPAVRAAYLGV